MSIHTFEKYWILETELTAYAFGLNDVGLLTHCYWNNRLPRLADYPRPVASADWASFNGAAHLTTEEYPAYGNIKYIDPCLKMTFADGVRDTDLQFISATVGPDNMQLDIQLQDSHYSLLVNLHYRVYEAFDLIERWVTISNTGAEDMLIERVFSAQWHLPYGDAYRMTHLGGRWFDEFNIYRDELTQGIKTIESRRLTTSHHHSPWFAIDAGKADESNGNIWFATLAWSGNWKIAAEVTRFMSTRVNIGLNDFDFAWILRPGETFSAPHSIGGFTTQGFGAASRMLHDFVRDTVLTRGRTLRKVLYNSWEATFFDVDEQSQLELAKLAAEMGVELFVLDDGWFHGRKTDNAGLGDWWPDETKFPNGLQSLIKGVNDLGMDFGLWIEPEMVNPDSELYRQHPEWVIHFPTRERKTIRDQLILNMARSDVQEYLIDKLDQLLRENSIAFIKWDMNRNVSEPGWPEAPGDQRELWVRYVQGLYRVWQTLANRHPNVIWQSCSGGGGRADLGILHIADQIWVSDNSTSTARLRIHEGFSQIFPANTMESWVTDVEGSEVPLKFKMHVSMCGLLGIGGHLNKWSVEDRKEVTYWIEVYKEIRHIIQFGALYRLRSPQQHNISALQYVSKEHSESVVFVFRLFVPRPPRLPLIYLEGLDPNAIYVETNENIEKSGLAWMNVGLPVPLANFESQILHLRKVRQTD